MSSQTGLLAAAWIVVSSTAAIVSLPGSLELLLLIAGSILPRRRAASGDKLSLRNVAVVVPAHNEETMIARTVRSLSRADRTDFQADIVVVADNCSDRTAQIALEEGARVLMREDAPLRGKGCALDFVFCQLLKQDYQAFLVVDADTEVSRDFLSEMVAGLRSGADAVQARYLLLNPNESIRTRLISVGNRAFNVLRARGRDRLGLSCGIYGNGFGISRATLEKVPYSASSIVEDLEYHLALVRSGRKIRFVETTSVYGETPSARRAAASQRTRWEGGRFRMIREHAPTLLVDVLRGRFRCTEPLLDLLLLPLAFHVTLLAVAASSPFALARVFGIVGLALTAIHLLLAIAFADGTWGELVALLAAPVYIGWKLLLLPALARSSRVNTAWVRTERNFEGRAQ